MGRVARIAVAVLIVLAALLAVNAVVLDNQTKPAEVNAPGGRILELASVDLQVVDHPPTGDGPAGEPIVLLHCFGCSLRWWDAVLPALNERHRVVTIDLIGHGGSEKPQSGYEIASQGAAVAEALSDLGVQRATIVGHSLGGVVATSVAETASEVADRVVLIGAGSEQPELPLPARVLSTPVIGQALWRLHIGPLVKSGYEAAFAPGFDVSGGFDDPDQVIADSEAMTYGSFEDAGAAVDDYVDEGTLGSRLAATGVPLLVLDGTEDQILDAAKVEAEFAAVPGAKVELIEGTGHSLQVEDPEDTAQLILDFAEEGEPTSGRTDEFTIGPRKGRRGQ